MHTSGIQALIVLTDPACVYTLDLVHDGLTSAALITERVSERLRISIEHASEVLDGLVGIGYISRTALGDVECKGMDDFDDHCRAGIEHIAWLRSVGDEQHAHDIVEAIYAAWDTRSIDPARRRRGAAFRVSEAGLRHERRLRARSMGFAFADFGADEPTDGDEIADVFADRFDEAG